MFAVLFNLKLPSMVTCDTGTIVPLYLYPQTINGIHNWQPLIDAYKKYSIPVWAIINVNNGPGTKSEKNYVQAINMLKSNGIHTLGYVRTNYGKQDISLVKKDVDTWKSLYKPEGIFFDEMANEKNANLVSYYTQLDKYAKGKEFTFTVGNPGTDVDMSYVGSVDTIMIYESSGSFPTASQYCGVHANYPKKRWGIFPYNLPSLTNIQDQILAAKNCVGFIYVSNDSGANPWDTLTSYLKELFALLKM